MLPTSDFRSIDESATQQMRKAFQSVQPALAGGKERSGVETPSPSPVEAVCPPLSNGQILRAEALVERQPHRLRHQRGTRRAFHLDLAVESHPYAAIDVLHVFQRLMEADT